MYGGFTCSAVSSVKSSTHESSFPLRFPLPDLPFRRLVHTPVLTEKARPTQPSSQRLDVGKPKRLLGTTFLDVQKSLALKSLTLIALLTCRGTSMADPEFEALYLSTRPEPLTEAADIHISSSSLNLTSDLAEPSLLPSSLNNSSYYG